MNITREERERVAEYMHLAQENLLYEFEARVVNKHVDVYRFSSVLQYLRSKKYKYVQHETTLDVNFSIKKDRYRYSIGGQNDISSYCRYNDTTTVKNETLITKDLVENKNGYFINDYNMKVNLKNEEDIPLDGEKAQEVKLLMKNVPKTYRLKKRFSFETEDGLFRYDLTVVKQSLKADATCMADSGLDKSDDTYEFELEFVGRDKHVDMTTLTKSFFKHYGLLLCLIENDDYIMRTSDKQKVVEEYRALVSRMQEPGKRPIDFIGPMPITLERKNIIEKTEPWIDTILTDYTVTEKADGERFLMFIDKEGRVFIINNRMSIKNTGLLNKALANSIIDGEYVTRSYTGIEIKLFMCFDVYILKGKDVREYPLLDVDNTKGRIERLNEAFALHKFEGVGSMRVRIKKFYDGDILNASQKLLADYELKKMEYVIDGLIFTPRKLAVGAMYESDKPSISNTWPMVFKWKPPHDNTIDFLVVSKKTSSGAELFEVVNDEMVRVFDLYVGLNPKSVAKLKPYDVLAGRKVELESDVQVPKLFQPIEGGPDDLSQCIVKIGKDDKVHCKNGDVFYDNSVVECAFENGHWVPLRIRKDKTEMSKKQIAANNYFTAMNIWTSIQNPVTQEMIIGKEKVEYVKGEEDKGVYYNKSVTRNRSASYGMLNFHNHWVKNRNMLGLFSNTSSKSIFDIGCAKGNDIHKYINNGFKTVVGIDKSVDNIMNIWDGAYARYLETRKKRERQMRNMTMVFLPMDFSTTIVGEQVNAYLESEEKDEDARRLVKVLWGQERDEHLPQALHGLVARKFDVVACQFAIHYFFENAKTVEAFFNNVEYLIKDNGYFIGTCLDAEKVNTMFDANDTKKDGVVQGEKEKRIVWRIKKMYEEFDDKNPVKNIGKRIDVYMETINKEFTEYLVDYRVLVLELGKRGIRPLNDAECQELKVDASTGHFDDLFVKMEKSGEKNDAITSALDMTKVEKDYSFMNRWFIFKKADDGSPRHPSPQEPKRKVVRKKVKDIKV